MMYTDESSGMNSHSSAAVWHTSQRLSMQRIGCFSCCIMQVIVIKNCWPRSFSDDNDELQLAGTCIISSGVRRIPRSTSGRMASFDRHKPCPGTLFRIGISLVAIHGRLPTSQHTSTEGHIDATAWRMWMQIQTWN